MTMSSRHFLHPHVTVPVNSQYHPRHPTVQHPRLSFPQIHTLSFRPHYEQGTNVCSFRCSRTAPQIVSYTPVHSCVPEFEFRTEGDEVTRPMCVGLPQNVHKPAAVLTITTASKSMVTAIKHSSYMKQNWGRCKLERQTAYTVCASRGSATYRMVTARTASCNITAW
jgi:hypothetical protein